ncbi:MAG: hypothetical protein JWO96_332 [Candidatus Saccharibacteria bacterium]|nr:hypothetical protein [Candidatus Saccharibacteria bacterium]
MRPTQTFILKPSIEKLKRLAPGIAQGVAERAKKWNDTHPDEVIVDYIDIAVVGRLNYQLSSYIFPPNSVRIDIPR